jgi:hypothetical protein
VADGVDVSEHEARTYLGRLFNADKVRKPEHGLYTPVVTVATVASAEGAQPESNTRNTRNSPLDDPIEDQQETYDPYAFMDFLGGTIIEETDT